MRRYWLIYDGYGDAGWPPQVGVTACCLPCAMSMAERRWRSPAPELAAVIQDVDVSLVDPPSWQASFGVPVWPGVWCPALNLQASWSP